jgi:hypothetical protein
MLLQQKHGMTWSIHLLRLFLHSLPHILGVLLQSLEAKCAQVQPVPTHTLFLLFIFFRYDSVSALDTPKHLVISQLLRSPVFRFLYFCPISGNSGLV